jgi:hypothetical protein
MSGFNKSGVAVSRARLTSPVQTASASDARTYNDGAGFTRDAKGELFLLAVTNMVGEDTFYEAKGERDQRFRNLVRQVTREDPNWAARFIPWLRSEANMRTASVVAAVEFSQVHKAVSGADVTARSVVASALQRADEPGEALAYAKTMGYPLAGGLQRGVADAATRLYNERSLLKYDSNAKGFRFGDVLELTHARPKLVEREVWDEAKKRNVVRALPDERQAALFSHAITRRHNRDNVELAESLTTLRARKQLDAIPVEQRRALVLLSEAPVILKSAELTWEALSGWLQGPMDAAAWEAIIPSMGYMALLRNLRNFDQARVSDAVAGGVAQKLADPDEVARSRQLPMRFLSAYNAAPSLRWAWPLEQALQASLQNVPSLGGRTLVMADMSTSMNKTFSRDGSLQRWDAAAMFGLALALRCANADLVAFSSNQMYYSDQPGVKSKVFPLAQGGSLLKSLEKWKNDGYFLGGGTETAGAIRQHYAGHDRVVVLTDEQADRNQVEVSNSAPANVPLYTFNLAGYRVGHSPSGSDNRHTFGGLTDHGFKLLALLESRKSGTWPF